MIRFFLKLSLVAFPLLLLLASPDPRPDKTGAATGPNVPSLSGFDRMMTKFLADNKLPGAAVAVTRNGRLVYARGFGLADVQRKQAVQPTSLFRIASISKPFTAVAILQLVEKGKIKLTDRVFDILKITPHLEKGKKVDPRLRLVTVRQCLQHTGGWDRDKSYDPMFIYQRIAQSLKIKLPLHHADIIRYMWGQPLDFNPGERYAYSNFGYCVLGRVIEKASGLPYEKYIQSHVLAPLGIGAMRVGKTLAAQRAPKEVTYYPPNPKQTAPAVVGQIGKPAPLPYGPWSTEIMDAHGGWIASPIDLVRFASAFDRPAQCKVLKPASIETMFAPPPGPAGHLPNGKIKGDYYASGWSIVLVGGGGRNTWHSGLLDGTSTILVRRSDGLCWAVLFNSSAGKQLPSDLVDGLMHQVANSVKAWPSKDLFGTVK